MDQRSGRKIESPPHRSGEWRILRWKRGERPVAVIRTGLACPVPTSCAGQTGTLHSVGGEEPAGILPSPPGRGAGGEGPRSSNVPPGTTLVLPSPQTPLPRERGFLCHQRERLLPDQGRRWRWRWTPMTGHANPFALCPAQDVGTGQGLAALGSTALTGGRREDEHCVCRPAKSDWRRPAPVAATSARGGGWLGGGARRGGFPAIEAGAQLGDIDT